MLGKIILTLCRSVLEKVYFCGVKILINKQIYGMETTTTLMEPDLPQLRQMVLENTRRINRNEMMINKMRMENDEEARKKLERDEWLENFRRESDESMRKSRERMDRLERFEEVSRIEHEKRIREWDERIAKGLEEHREEFAKEMKERDERIAKGLEEHREEFAKEMKERDERFAKGVEEHQEKFAKEMKERDERFAKEMKERDERFDREMKESHEKFSKELKENMDETNAAIRRISIEFLGATGHIVEGLASSAVEKIFKEAGLDLLHYGKNIKPMQPEVNGKAEIDVLLGNDVFFVPVEVKADFTKKKVQRFVRRMEKFREFFPEYANKEIIAAVAAINYEDGADQLAHEEGLLVIRVSSDDIFSLDPFDVNTLRRF